MTDADPHAADEHDSPPLRQRLHAATGDRHAEAEVVAERAGESVGADEAEIAVRRAHGDIDPEHQPPFRSELASPDDAREVKDQDSQ